ncbi:hypothetical protein OJ996_23645 [Luteolibacter sp. GHJ8]|uniref:MOSC domain-containing protein n=1 Tax=Luteolibacter rhizosphaerae TaxID=2989719 RepID=A0ABT3G9T2_9BACT|nr:hypothetical protein [Luteolibacter rhizosphaerae]MCW1916602.1 hypothetical protein [Luteolibacter rhizosphaerae]
MNLCLESPHFRKVVKPLDLSSHHDFEGDYLREGEAIAGERLHRDDCEIGDWVLAAGVPEWTTKTPRHLHLTADHPGRRLFVRGLRVSKGEPVDVWVRM